MGDGRRYKSHCRVSTNVTMYWQSPSVDTLDTSKWLNITTPQPKRLEYGFIMDNVDRVQNLSSQLMFSKWIDFYPDPEFTKFEDLNGIKLHKSDCLTLNGKNLNKAVTENDIQIRIGTQLCNVTSVSQNHLTCKPPNRQPPARLAEGRPDPTQL